QKIVSQVIADLKPFSEQFASSKITQEFSLAVLDSSSLKQSIYCPRCFSFVFTLFNLQGTVAFRSRGQLH
ncbi:MAG: hypothetical protein PUH32_03685, partial [Firmicutes bacterium]|nr:hypothetical protein [Bacillota bacterium]